jgi:hypothetical protein
MLVTLKSFWDDLSTGGLLGSTLRITMKGKGRRQIGQRNWSVIWSQHIGLNQLHRKVWDQDGPSKLS